MLRRIKLTNFRSYNDFDLNLAKGVNLIVGLNAKGKTNLLEAVYLLGVGDSFKAKRTEEMVAFGSEFGKVGGVIGLDNDDEMEIEVLVNGGVLMGKKVNKRKYMIDGVSRRRQELAGLMPVVLFRPEDVEVVSGSPDTRRKFLDHLLIQADAVYGSSLSTYEQALRRRNKLLDAIREGVATRHALTYWDGLLIRHGGVVQEKRRELVGYINRLFGKSEMFKELLIEYDMSAVSESRLAQYKEAELAVGYTLVGPHKDDLVFREKERDLSVYGSRGEQRMAVLALKMGEIYFVEERTGKKVLMLLDDVFSELDEVHKNEVMKLIKGRQVMVTTADYGDEKLFGSVNRVELI